MQGHSHDLDPENALEHLSCSCCQLTAAFGSNKGVKLEVSGKEAVGIGSYLLQINRMSLQV